MANLLLDLVDRLTAAGIVVGDGKDTFRDFMPDAPDVAISLVEYQGTTIPFVSLAQRNIQISVRHLTYEGSRTKCTEIYNYFNKEEPIFDADASGRWFTAFPKQPPFKLGKDSQNRTTFTFNCLINTYND